MSYELSAEADQDVLSIYRYGFERWGEARADAYYIALTEAFETIAEDPMRYQKVEGENVTYRRAVFRSNAIYFRLQNDTVLIVRILGRQDPAEAFG
ncbi:MAG: type II toxin-antitoxin system RelE/ParE family toxin [Pseudomonadota bacterium]